MSPRAEDFDYALPDDLIAQRPIEPRSAARLLVDRGTTTPADLTVSQLPSLLRPGDLLVVNDTRVIPARVHLQRRSGGAVEVLLLERSNADEWTCLLRPARRIRDGESLVDASGRVIATVKGRTPGDDQMTFVICAAVSEKSCSSWARCPCRRTSPLSQMTQADIRLCMHNARPVLLRRPQVYISRLSCCPRCGQWMSPLRQSNLWLASTPFDHLVNPISPSTRCIPSRIVSRSRRWRCVAPQNE